MNTTVLKKYNLFFLFVAVLYSHSTFAQDDSTANILVSLNTSERLRYDTIFQDSSFTGFHIYKKFEKHSISQSYLGNYGSANFSNIFTEQVDDYDLDFLFNKPYFLYLMTPENQKYYNTRKPYTDISYFSSTKVKDEQSLYFTHTQNINPKFNFGIDYSLISSKGNYPNQKNRCHNFGIQNSYISDNYSVSTSLIVDKFTLQDNGGLVDTGLIDINSLESYLAGASTKISNRYITAIQRYRFGSIKNIKINDTTSVEAYSSGISLVHKFQHTKSYRIYSDKQGDANGYYRNFYYDIPGQDAVTYDSIAFRNLENTLGFSSEEMFMKKYKFGFDIFYKNQLKKYYNFKRYVFLENETYFNDNSAVFDVYNNNKKKLNINLQSEYYFTGYRNGDIKSVAEIVYKSGKRDSLIFLALKFINSKYKPDFFLQNFYSNHYIFNNDFNSINSTQIAFEFNIPRMFFEIGADYNILHNYVYYGTLQEPLQLGDKITVSSAFIKKVFHAGIWNFDTKIVWQKASNTNVMSLPAISGFNSTYIDFQWKSLEVNLGLDVWITTKYYMSGYNPAVGQFFFENSTQTGNYPIINAFVSGRIMKDVLVFIKYEHLNSGIIKDLDYTVNHYPVFPRIMKFGVRWTFKN